MCMQFTRYDLGHGGAEPTYDLGHSSTHQQEGAYDLGAAIVTGAAAVVEAGATYNLGYQGGQSATPDLQQAPGTKYV